MGFFFSFLFIYLCTLCTHADTKEEIPASSSTLLTLPLRIATSPFASLSSSTVSSSSSARKLYRLDGIPIHGSFNELAYHYVELSIGTPSQSLTVIIDTGSSILGLPCDDCASCGKQQRKFFKNISQTMEKVPCTDDHFCSSICTLSTDTCRYTRTYSEGSRLEGIYLYDYVGLSPSASSTIIPSSSSVSSTEKGKNGNNGDYQDPQQRVRMQFGCHTTEQGLIAEQITDGILGLSQGSLSFIQTLVRSKRITRNTFSLCMAPSRMVLPTDTSTDTNGAKHTNQGGILTLGGIDPRLHLLNRPLLTSTLYTYGGYGEEEIEEGYTIMRISPNNGFYVVSVRGVRIVSALKPKVPRTDSKANRYSSDLLPLRTIDNEPFGNPIEGSTTTSGPAVLDTGSSFTYLPEGTVDSLIRTIQSYCVSMEASSLYCLGTFVSDNVLPEAQTLCINMDTVKSTVSSSSSLSDDKYLRYQQIIDSYPTVQIEFIDGAVYSVPSRYLFMVSPWTYGYACLGIYPLPANDERIVLGANIMHGRDITFDTDTESWAWMPANCTVNMNVPPRLVNDNTANMEASESAIEFASTRKTTNTRGTWSNHRVPLGTVPSKTGSSKEDQREAAFIGSSRLLLYGAFMGILGVIGIVMARISLNRYRIATGRAYTALSTIVMNTSAGNDGNGTVDRTDTKYDTERSTHTGGSTLGRNDDDDDDFDNDDTDDPYGGDITNGSSTKGKDNDGDTLVNVRWSANATRRPGNNNDTNNGTKSTDPRKPMRKNVRI